jgi:hypothetical protein
MRGPAPGSAVGSTTRGRATRQGGRLLKSLCEKGLWPLVVGTSLCVVAFDGAGGRVLVVDYDPDSPEGRVEAAVMQAASGDTVQVMPGVYYEHFELPDIRVAIVGAEGPEVTILDGSRDFPGRQGSIIWSEGYERHPTLFVRGLTFQNGKGSITDLGRHGGAILSEHCSLEAENCVFRDNEVGTEYNGRGGAIYAGSVQFLILRDCRFAGNRAEGPGGAVRVGQADSIAQVVRCDFDVDPVTSLATGATIAASN